MKDGEFGPYLSEWVIMVIKTHQARSPEFQAALQYWGREKFEAIWRAHVQEMKKCKQE
jgi:hypothetical protein